VQGYTEPNYRPVGSMEIPGAIQEQDNLQGIHTGPGPHKDDANAYKTGFRPHLQGALLPVRLFVVSPRAGQSCVDRS
jgi:hypothetical protein